MGLDLSQNRLKEIESEVYGDTQKYLENCSRNYSEYISAAQKLFPNLYKEIELFEKNYPLLEHLSDYEKAKINDDLESQIAVLKKGIENRIYTPATYDRLAKAYEKKKEIKLAYDVCVKWFETNYWKLPNTCKGSLRILKRLKRLEKNTLPNNDVKK